MNERFTMSILRWFAENRRDLPWRNTTDPYAIWLSEVILQQTRIQQGMAYWQRFMERWPTVEQLASATEDEVLRLWQGLGYYSRARNLHHAARQIVAMGGFPTTLEGIKSLKGVGDYTAAAIGSIAFGLPVAVVDGNVYRVLARYFGIDTPINSTEGKKLFAALAQEQLPKDQPSEFNQAMMDFGAIRCTPASPRCLLCPLMDGCEALRSGRITELPVKLKTLKVRERHLSYLYIRYQGQTAIRRRGEGDIWQGLWEVPQVSLPSPRGGEAPQEQAQELGAFEASPLEGNGMGAILLRKSIRHILTHRIIIADFYLWEPVARPVLPEEYVWIAEEDIDQYGMSRLMEMLVEEVRNYAER